MRVSSRARLKITVLIAASGLLSGCSQAQALAPVGGERVVEIRVATIGILMEEHVAIFEAPHCTRSNSSVVRCAGTTTDQKTIVSVGNSPDLDRFVVTVGGKTIYDGSVDRVLQRAASSS